MGVYVVTFCIIAGILVVNCSNLIKQRRDSWWIAAIVASVLVFVSGFRYRVGTDYAAYMNGYETLLRKELSFAAQPALTLIARVSQLIYPDYAVWFFLMAFITIGCSIYGIKKYSPNFSFSVLLYLFLGCWHYGFNAVKQSAATAVLLCGFCFLRDRRFWPWCLTCLLATMFHISALFMIPVYFIAVPEFSWRHTGGILLCGAAVLVCGELLFEVMARLRGTGFVTSGSSEGARNVNVLRILVNIAPILMWFPLRKHYDTEDRHFATLLNMSIFSATMAVSTMSSVYLTRFMTYLLSFDALFIPCVPKVFQKKDRIIISGGMLVLYFVFWMYDLNKGASTRTFQWIFHR